MKLQAGRLALGCILCLAGCFPRQRAESRHIVYDGPTAPLATVIQQINANNQRINTLWASGDFEASVQDEKQQSHHLDGDQLLLAFRKPNELKLAGEKLIVGRIFEAGSNPQQYWLHVPFDLDTMWWGEYRNGMRSKSIGGIPIRPDLLVEVLGVNTINADLHQPPWPVMRFNNDEDVYMITFDVMLADRMIAQKEIWYDRATYLPKLISFFDENGRIMLRADLSEHQHLNRDPAAPMVATRYDLYFVQSRTKLIMNLENVKESYKGTPNDRSFRFPGEHIAGKTYRVDEASSQ